MNGDIFELVPVNPYSREDLNYNNENSRVSREHDDVNLRNVELTKTSADGWDTYETVFIGYPIWWGIAAWPVDGFIKNNDFSGKTVIPFCTSASFGIGAKRQTACGSGGNGKLAGRQKVFVKRVPNRGKLVGSRAWACLLIQFLPDNFSL